MCFFDFWVNGCFKMEVSQIFTCGDNNWCFEGKHASPSVGKSDSSAIHCSFPATRTELVSGCERLQQHRDLNPKSLDNIPFHSAPHCRSPGPAQSRGIVCVNSMQGIMAHGMKPKRICKLLSLLLCFSIGSPLFSHITEMEINLTSTSLTVSFVWMWEMICVTLPTMERESTQRTRTVVGVI